MRCRDRIFKGDQIKQISQVSKASSNAASKRDQGHLQISWQLGFDELVGQLQLYGVVPPLSLEVSHEQISHSFL